MKKLSIILILLLTLGLGLFAAGSKEAAAKDEGPVELWVVYRAPPYHDRLFVPNMDKFEAQNPNIKVKFQHVEHKEYTYKLQLMFASGEVPDSFEMNLNQNYDFFAVQGLFRDLTPYVERDNIPIDEFLKPLIDRIKQPGGLYMIPIDSHPGMAGMFYNKTLFNEAGLSHPDDTWTYDDLLKSAIALTKKDAGGKTTQYGLIAPNRWVAVMTTLHSFGGHWLDDNGKKSGLLMPGSVQAYHWISDLFHKHQVSPQADQMVAQNANKSFSAGQSAMMIAGPWQIGVNRDGLAEQYEAAAAPIPIGPKGRISGGVNYGAFPIPTKAKHPDEAWEFVKFFLSDDMLYQVVKQGMNLTTKAKINNKPEFYDEWFKPYIDQLSDGVYMMSPIPANYRVGEMRNIITSSLDPIWLGEVGVDEGLKEADKALQAVLDKPSPE